MVQQFEPIYCSPDPKTSFFQHPFFIGEKRLLGKTMDTFSANLLVIWMMTVALYLVLQFDILNRFFSRSS